MTDVATVSANSVISLPVLPCANESGMNTAASVMVIAMTAKPISRVPTSAALKGFMPSSMCRWTFSSTTIASSTTRPIDSTTPSSVSVLIEKPSIFRIVKWPMIDTGIVIAGISVARTSRRKKKITSTTSASASMIVVYTALIDDSMNCDVSTATQIFMPGWSDASSFGSIPFTACATSSVLAVDCFTMPRPRASSPRTRTTLRFS